MEFRKNITHNPKNETLHDLIVPDNLDGNRRVAAINIGTPHDVTKHSGASVAENAVASVHNLTDAYAWNIKQQW